MEYKYKYIIRTMNKELLELKEEIKKLRAEIESLKTVKATSFYPPQATYVWPSVTFPGQAPITYC